MCSICGIATRIPDPRNPGVVVDMLQRTRHRGPDGCGLHQPGRSVYGPTPESLASLLALEAPAPRVVLGQARLRITGSEDARQPLVSGRLALAHNGEIYNHETLARLLGKDAPVESGCDSETLLRVLAHHHAATGSLPEAARRTVAVASGMYAFAVTDGEALVLARDPVGKKPLYYVDGARRFAFASERKALLPVAADEDVPIRRLCPGEMLVLEPGLPLQITTVERLPVPAVDLLDMEEAVAAYERALLSAIEKRTRGVARAAVFFSGGVDSVLVARLLTSAGVDVTGYVVGTDDSSDVKAALEVAREMRLRIRVTRITEPLVAEWLPRILEAAELNGPMMAEVSVPMWFAAKAAHEDGHRIVFTGQGADELFAGYEWYRGVLAREGPLTLHARLWEDVRALPVDTLEREDRISMAWALEMRAPFLDVDVIRTAMRISPTLKLLGPDDALGKRPHRLLARRLGVPESIALRAKVPAQDGSSIHTLLESLARRRFPGAEPHAPDLADFGSNYRYRDRPGAYGSRRVRALLAEIVAQHGFVVASDDGSARVPTAAPTPRPHRARPEPRAPPVG